MKNIVVTGAYGGMGRATIKTLCEHGYRVFAIDKSVGDAEENLIPVKADITSEKSVAEAFYTVRKHADSLFAIIHFAGIYMLDSLVEIESESFDSIFNINLRGAYLVNKAFLPLMKKGSRVIITTSELAPIDPLPFTGIYAITKSALDKYAYSLAMELQLMGISVSVLRAGAVDTGMIGASTSALDKFCEKTKLYNCNAKRFKQIVNRVEARAVSPSRIAEKMLKILKKRNPSFSYTVNRNPLLLLLNALPKRIQMLAIRLVLRQPKSHSDKS